MLPNKSAFRYIKHWLEYEPLLDLFQRMKEPEKALLAALFLARYQLEANQIELALGTLAYWRPRIPQAALPIIHLYQGMQQTDKAIALGLEIAPQMEPVEALELYLRLLDYEPTEWRIYPLLLPLLDSPLQKSHLLLRGACHAIEKAEFVKASQFLEQAKLEDQPFIDNWVWVDQQLMQKLNPKENLQKLALRYVQKGQKYEAMLAYKVLCSLEYNPEYYKGIIACGETPKRTFRWIMRYLSELIRRNEWQEAERVAKEALTQGFEKIPLYEALEEVYSKRK